MFGTVTLSRQVQQLISSSETARWIVIASFTTEPAFWNMYYTVTK
jgi:hypothetical protein